MSELTLDRTLQLVESRNYPVLAGHTGLLDISIGDKRSEGQKSDAVLARLSKLGSLIAPILAQGDSTEISKAPDSQVIGPNPTRAPCSSSSWAWAQAYLLAVDKMGGAPVALGSDFNGFAGEPAPRYGADACKGGENLSSAQQQLEAAGQAAVKQVFIPVLQFPASAKVSIKVWSGNAHSITTPMAWPTLACIPTSSLIS